MDHLVARPVPPGTPARASAPHGHGAPGGDPEGGASPAICALIGCRLPFADIAAMNAHLAEIARTIAPDPHAVLVLDSAG